MIHREVMEVVFTQWATGLGYSPVRSLADSPQINLAPGVILYANITTIRSGYNFRALIQAQEGPWLSVLRKIDKYGFDNGWDYPDYFRGVILEGLESLWEDYCSQYGVPSFEEAPVKLKKIKVVI